MKESPRQVSRQTTSGIVLRCTDTIFAFRPDGSKIISRYWGDNRSALSQHKIIILEIAKRHREKREITRQELKILLDQEIRRSSGLQWNDAQLSERLSTLLSQIKKTFSPYSLFEKTEKGYRLHESVSVDTEEPQRTSASQYSFYNHNIFSL